MTTERCWLCGEPLSEHREVPCTTRGVVGEGQPGMRICTSPTINWRARCLAAERLLHLVAGHPNDAARVRLEVYHRAELDAYIAAGGSLRGDP